MLAMAVIEERELRDRLKHSAIPAEAHPAFRLNARKQDHWSKAVDAGH
jgi:hypothetical protein